jgi:hypothetical protein
VNAGSLPYLGGGKRVAGKWDRQTWSVTTVEAAKLNNFLTLCRHSAFGIGKLLNFAPGTCWSILLGVFIKTKPPKR